VAYGGPYLGIFCLPGGSPAPDAGKDRWGDGGSGGPRGFVLTVQTREQHIRREKATPTSAPTKPLRPGSCGLPDLPREKPPSPGGASTSAKPGYLRKALPALRDGSPFSPPQATISSACPSPAEANRRWARVRASWAAMSWKGLPGAGELSPSVRRRRCSAGKSWTLPCRVAHAVKAGSASRRPEKEVS